jgi:peptidoglycan/xylan/chitin deacetylase (PgdA/CDA1 family)
MKITALEYHDVVPSGAYESSGMRVVGADRYKLEEHDFEQHMLAIRDSGRTPQDISKLLTDPSNMEPLALTFDDGGASAIQISELLDNLGWCGHFFVPTDFIGTRLFLNVQQLRSIRRNKHVIGTHSCSHPTRMSACSWAQQIQEWGSSRKTLENILGEEVTVGSVPGGHYSKQVAQTAAEVGIRILFTSDPTTKTQNINGCTVIGRYTIYRGMAANSAAALASGNLGAQITQLLSWNTKKVIKAVAGDYYLAMRHLLLGNVRTTRIR